MAGCTHLDSGRAWYVKNLPGIDTWSETGTFFIHGSGFSRERYPDSGRATLLGAAGKTAFLFRFDLSFTAAVPDYQDMTRADMPQLRFMLSGGGQYEFHNGNRMETPEVCMVGPTMGATKFYLDGTAEVFGISGVAAGLDRTGVR
jgi:hypothetical protein